MTATGRLWHLEAYTPRHIWSGSSDLDQIYGWPPYVSPLRSSAAPADDLGSPGGYAGNLRTRPSLYIVNFLQANNWARLT
jgi:hypothetical protein